MAVKSLMIISIFLYLICFNVSVSYSESEEEDEDLTFLQQIDAASSSGEAHPYRQPRYYGNCDSLVEDQGNEFSTYTYEDISYSAREVDETHVVVLKESNFTEFIEKNRFVMVDFYAPWCRYSQALAPEYAEAAAELKDEEVALAKVDATDEWELARKIGVVGFPTVYFFVDGVHEHYTGELAKDVIVSWLKKKIGPGLRNTTTIEEAEAILAAQDKIILGYLDGLVGLESEELGAASKPENGVSFYQTTSPDVAKLFHIDPLVKRPALVIVKKEAEKLNHFDGQFTKSAITEFVLENKLALVINYTQESYPQLNEHPIKKQLILFATSNDSEKLYPLFLEAAKAFKGKLLFVYVDFNDDDVGETFSENCGVSKDAASVIAYTGHDDGSKFLLDGELTISSIKSFGEKFLLDNLQPFYKSDPIPEKNDGDVKIVVGKNFDEIVLDESKDVFLEIYVPWCARCGHCKPREPIYNKLVKYLRGINSLVISKMDATRNEHSRAKSDHFPTLLFFPAGNKSFDPITFDDDHTVGTFYKFLKKHASIPFKLQKPDSPEKSTASSDATANHERSSSSSNLKDVM